MADYLSFLPKKGVSGTLYLYLYPQAPPVEKQQWNVLSWDGKQYHCHATEASLEDLRARADTLLWAKGWPRVECCAPERKINPCIRVEFEYVDGRIQRLTGNAAEAWLKNVDGIIAMGELRYGQTQMNDHPWQFARKDQTKG